MSQPLPPYRPHQHYGACTSCGAPPGASARPSRPHSLTAAALTALAIPFALAMCVVTPVVGFAVARGVARSIVPLATLGPRSLHPHRARVHRPVFVRPAGGYVPYAQRVAPAYPCPFAGMNARMQPPPPFARPVPEPAYAPAPGSMLAQAGPFTQNPWELLRRARALVAGGAPVQLRETTVDTQELARAATNVTPERIVVEHRPDGSPQLRIVFVPAGSPFARLGLVSRDVIVAVNGRDPFSYQPGSTALYRAPRHEPTVVEVLRNDRRRMVFVTHASAPSAASTDLAAVRVLTR